MKISKPIQDLVEEFNKLPGVGEKSSQRFVYYLLGKSDQELKQLAELIAKLKEKIRTCEICYNYDQKSPCLICTDSKRNKSIICVVAQASDIQVIEKTGEYQGVYHVLGGLLNPIEGVGPENLHLKELVNRIKKDGIKEIILALNPDLDGESTVLYLTKVLKPLKIKITCLGRGLPMGGDLEYVDEITLSNALRGRKEI